MKQDYLDNLLASLKRHQVVDADIEDIMSDYDGMYEDALSRGKSDEDIESLLGKPDEVVKELFDTLRVRDFKVVRKKNNRLVALSPFLALIAFMLLGFLGDLWHPGWLVFLFIPIAGILGNVNKKEKFVALSPFIALITFIFLSVAYQLWHPGWLVFLIIPVAGILTGAGRRDRAIALMPFLTLTAFILVGTYVANAWLWAWLFFLLIPLVAAIFYSKKKIDRFLLAPSILLAAGFYLVMYLHYDNWQVGLFGLLLPTAILIISGQVRISFEGMARRDRWMSLSILLICLSVFLVLGLMLPGAWSWCWMVLLGIPMLTIAIKVRPFKFTPLMPFIAVIIFFSLGFFLGYWTFSWMAFLLIPMVAIIENA